MAAEFTGAVPAPEIERFLDGLAPSEADQLAERAAAEGDEQGLREALARDPGEATTAVALARLLLRRGDAAQEALEILEPVAATDFIAAGLAARARLELSDRAPRAAFDAWDAGEHARALELLQEEVAAADSELREELRQVMVAIFTELGPQSSLASEHRRRLAAALN